MLPRKHGSYGTVVPTGPTLIALRSEPGINLENAQSAAAMGDTDTAAAFAMRAIGDAYSGVQYHGVQNYARE